MAESGGLGVGAPGYDSPATPVLVFPGVKLGRVQAVGTFGDLRVCQIDALTLVRNALLVVAPVQARQVNPSVGCV